MKTSDNDSIAADIMRYLIVDEVETSGDKKTEKSSQTCLN